MPWVKTSLTKYQYNLVMALLLSEKDDNTNTIQNDDIFEQKLKEAREREIKRQKEIEEKIYTSSDKNDVLKESQDLLARKVMNSQKKNQ